MTPFYGGATLYVAQHAKGTSHNQLRAHEPT